MANSLHLMVVGGFIPERVPGGSADKLPEAVEPALACVAPGEEATALEAALRGEGIGAWPVRESPVLGDGLM